MPFIPDTENNFRNEAFVCSLRVLADRLALLSDSIYLSKQSLLGLESLKKTQVENRSGSIIADTILQRACRTGTGSDSFFVGNTT